ncbi:MAG: S9 family peptidase [Chloroherpetonaceae bacterium]|nr:S9 family peptidase [Chloroherpetonaceae bacterium]
MKKLLIILALISSGAAGIESCAPTTKEPTPPMIPLRDFFRNPEKAGYQISPLGSFISYLAPVENRMNVFVYKRSDPTEPAKQITTIKDRDISGYFWKGESKILYAKDFGGDENFHVFAVNPDGTGERDLTPFDSVRAEIIDDLEDHPTDILVGLNKRDRENFDVYRLNTETGEMKMVAENPGGVGSWVTDHNGTIRIAIQSDGVNQAVLYRENDSAPFSPILTTSFKESLSPLFFTFDNTAFYAASNLGRDKAAIVKFDPKSVKETELLFEHPEVDVYSMAYSKKRKVLTAISFTTWKTEQKFLDAESEADFKYLQAQLPNTEVFVTSATKDESIFIVRTMSDRSRGAVYLFEKNTRTLSKLTEVAPWLNEDDLCEVKPISYQSRDGLTIHGYLTLPKGIEPKNLPVIVNPHGGPWARDEWGFDPEVQFLANRGYAVLQMNFRGSTGYGRAFWEASFKKWGKEMQNDITDGVAWLISQGIADKKRIAIYGGSYGGYATLAGLAFTPDLYACGVDYVGVSNIFTLMETIPPYWKPYLDQMYEMIGDPDKDSLLLRDASPVFHVDKIKAPLFVAQGARDPRVKKSESDQIVEALKNRGIDVPYLVKENEGHGFRNEENRFEFYEAMEKFLAKHLLGMNDL